MNSGKRCLRENFVLFKEQEKFVKLAHTSELITSLEACSCSKLNLLEEDMAGSSANKHFEIDYNYWINSILETLVQGIYGNRLKAFWKSISLQVNKEIKQCNKRTKWKFNKKVSFTCWISHLYVFSEKAGPKNLANFIGKHLW